MDRVIAAYERTVEDLGGIVAAMALDLPALRRPLRRCRLEVCGGTCCHDGVYLGTEEAAVLRQVVSDSREDFARLGLALPEKPVVYGTWQGSHAGPKTAVRSGGMRDRVSDYPAHFPDTACVFLLDDARCSLQILASERGLPPWFYKPVACWLHPLTLEGVEQGQPLLTLHSESEDPQRHEGYEGFVSHTHCGRTCPEGEPGYRVLAEELRFLGELGGRDLLAEIEAQDISRPNSF